MNQTPTPPPASEDDYGAPEIIETVASNSKGNPLETNKFAAASEPRLTLDPGNPLPSARTFIQRNYTTGDHRTLVHHAGQFFGWSGAH